jgi:hypothetical protein
MKNPSLRGTTGGPIKALAGFIKSTHSVPDARNDATMRFVRKAGTPDVTEALDQIYRSLKDVLGYKRRQLVSVDDFGSASIKTPDFDVNLSIEQDAQDEAKYRFLTEVAAFRRPEILLEEPFQQLFTNRVDTVVLEFSGAVDLEDKIALIEDREDLAGQLVDERDGSAFTLTLLDPPVRLRVTATDLSITLTGGRNLKHLIEYSMAAVAKMTSHGVSVLPV